MLTLTPDRREQAISKGQIIKAALINIFTGTRGHKRCHYSYLYLFNDCLFFKNSDGTLEVGAVYTRSRV